MSFSEIELDQMRTYLGFEKLFVNANPFLESAMKSLQSLTDGGSQVDSAIENATRVVLQNVAAIDASITNLSQQLVNLAVYKVPVSLSNGAVLEQDYRMALSTLRREGTAQIQKLAIRLGIHPMRTYFYSDGIEENPSLYQNIPSFTGRSRRH